MAYLHFIVNPISGKANHIIDEEVLRKHFPEDLYRIQVDYTEYRKHAVELTREAILKKPDCIIACGGDGTINEVASSLVDTRIKLGIIPVGSGNGLASNLEIPRDIEKAILIIKTGAESFIDVGKVNEHYFFSNMGIGIDAMIIKKYEKQKKRSLIGYVKASVSSSFKFKPIDTILLINGKRFEIKPLLLFISNSNEMGYKMSLTPLAKLNDGLLDLVIMPNLSFLEKITLGYAVLRNTVQDFKKARHILFQKCQIEMHEKIFTDVQIDGEYYRLHTNKIDVDILKKGLRVITP